MDDDEYGILTNREFSNLKRDIEDVKKRVSPDTTKQIVDSMAKLSQGMDSMLQLFKGAADEMKNEESSQEQFVKYLQPLSQKVDLLMEQTKVIAESMVGIVEMVKELKEENEKHHQTAHHVIHHASPMRQSRPAPPPMRQYQEEDMAHVNPYNENIMPPPQMRPAQQPFAPPPQSMFGAPMPPPPSPQFGAPPEDDLMDPFSAEQEPKRKGLLGRFRK